MYADTLRLATSYPSVGCSLAKEAYATRGKRPTNTEPSYIKGYDPSPSLPKEVVQTMPYVSRVVYTVTVLIPRANINLLAKHVKLEEDAWIHDPQYKTWVEDSG